MTDQLLLGIDVGSNSTKGVLTTAAGDVVATHIVQHVMSMPRPGYFEQDADAVWWADVVTVSRSLLAQGFTADQIGGVAVSAIGPCMLPVDDNGKPLRPGILYGIDTRAQAEIEELNQLFDPGDMFRLGGMNLTSQAIGPKILWFRKNEPELFAKTHKILTASSYLVYRLTGEYVIDKHTGSHFNPLIDINTLEWCDRFAEPIVDLDKLPRLAWSTEIAGVVTAAAAAETGLTIGTPVTVGTVDAAAEAVSVGAVEPGDLMVMYGTTMFFLLVTERPRPDPRVWATGFVFPDSYSIAGGLSTTGALTQWFRNEFGAEEMAAEAAGGPNAYAALSTLAAEIPPGSDGLVCLPYFAGERTPIYDADARGVFAGLTLTHTKAHLFRSILEGTAYGVRHVTETLQHMNSAPNRIVAVGGGARNPLWLQIVSDVSGVPQIVPDRTIGASYGNAFLAGLATGIISNMDVLRTQWVQHPRVIEPNTTLAALYDDYFRVYRSLYEHAKTDLHDLARLGRGSTRP